MITNYQNGNANITIHEDGTKKRIVKLGEKYSPLFPETVDLKITNYCDAGCIFCHESSTTSGLHCNVSDLLKIFKDLPSGLEIAIGGGNPLSHPELENLLYSFRDMGFICNITVKDQHVDIARLKKLQENKMIYGIGVSCSNNPQKYPEINNLVYHVIAGIHNVKILRKLCGQKVLVLGYKTYGFGKQFYNATIEAKIRIWQQQIHPYFNLLKVISFDNLAIEQLKIRRFFTSEEWNKFYMGDDFTASMYIDAVEQTFAPTSRSNDRKSWSELSLLDFFAKK